MSYTLTTAVIEEVSLNPTSRVLRRSYYEVPTRYDPLPSKKKPTRSIHLQRGRSTNVTIVHFLASVILQNEMSATKGTPMTRKQMRKILLKEYTSPKQRTTIYGYFEKLSYKRREYNQGVMYANMVQQPLYAWLYNDHGFIYHPSYRQVMMTFQDCRNELRQQKFMDPRFFSETEIENMRQRKLDGDLKAAQWHLPSLADLSHIKAHLKLDTLFKTIVFAEGYGPDIEKIV
jgi:hypothetical protein